MKVLFVCSQNCLRSPTAAFIYGKTDGIEARSAGVDFDIMLGDVEWADVIITMEYYHMAKIRKLFPQVDHKEIHVLGIEDVYSFLDPDLLAIMPNKISRWIGFPTARSEDDIEAAKKKFQRER